MEGFGKRDYSRLFVLSETAMLIGGRWRIKRMKRRKHTLYRSEQLEVRHKLVIHFVVFAILTIFIGKSLFVKSDLFFCTFTEYW